MKARHPHAWPEALLPWVVAESVCEEAGRYLGVAVPRRRALWLAAKADVCFPGERAFPAEDAGRGAGGVAAHVHAALAFVAAEA